MMFNSRAGYADAIAGVRFTSPTYSENRQSPPPRNGSVTTIATRPLTFGYGYDGVTFDRQMSRPAADEDVIMVTVKISNKDRRQSYDEALPSRPPKRSFLRRMSTRILPPAEQDKWKVVKMPRGEYKKHFVRDNEGNYAGSEPQKEWDEEDIQREFGMYQDVPVGSILS